MPYTATLADDGFIALPMRITGVGHFYLHGSLDGRPATFLLDTGAGSTVVDLGFARNCGLQMAKAGFKGGGAGADSITVYSLPPVEIVIAGFRTRFAPVHAMDMIHIISALAARGVDRPDVILGADLMRPCEAKIDYAGPTLFLKPLHQAIAAASDRNAARASA